MANLPPRQRSKHTVPPSTLALTDNFIMLVDETEVPPKRVFVLRPSSFDDARSKALVQFSHIYRLNWNLAVDIGEHMLVEVAPEAYDAVTRNRSMLYVIASPLSMTIRELLVPRNKLPVSTSLSDTTPMVSQAIRYTSQAANNILEDDNELGYPTGRKRPMNVDEDVDQSQTCLVAEASVKTEVDLAFPLKELSRQVEISIVWAKCKGWPWWPAQLFHDSMSKRIPGDTRRKWEITMANSEDRLYIVRYFPLDGANQWGFVTVEQLGQHPIGVIKDFDKNMLKMYKKYIRNNSKVFTRLEP